MSEREREGERRYKNVPPILPHKQARGASNDVFSFLTTARLSDRLSVYLFFSLVYPTFPPHT